MNTTVETIKQKISTDPKWAERAILALYERQTMDERISQQTNENNGEGFNGADAYILTSFASQLIRYKRPLSPKQLAIAFRKLPKYATQLYKIAQSKEQ